MTGTVCYAPEALKLLRSRLTEVDATSLRRSWMKRTRFANDRYWH
jgi:hypothetical protein